MATIWKILNLLLTLIPFVVQMVSSVRRKWEKKEVQETQKKIEEEVSQGDIDALNERLGFKKSETPKKEA